MYHADHRPQRYFYVGLFLFGQQQALVFFIHELCNDLINGFILWMTSLTSKEKGRDYRLVVGRECLSVCA